MDAAEAKVTVKAAVGLAQLSIMFGVALFVPAGTLHFVEAWVFLALFLTASLAITVYLAKSDPALLGRRIQAGPMAEKERAQKIIQGVASLAFLATIVVPALDHRFGWSRVPLSAVITGDILIALGFLIVFLVFKQNTFTSSTIEVAAEQRVIDSGPYAVVRHPMYVGGLVLVAGIPLALGSFVGLVTFPPFAAVIIWRLLDEEKFLVGHLAGYEAYREKTPYRLIPRVW
jgi:protein-S-isoprenylcysteine O-methyltransferase Ste14